MVAAIIDYCRDLVIRVCWKLLKKLKCIFLTVKKQLLNALPCPNIHIHILNYDMISYFNLIAP